MTATPTLATPTPVMVQWLTTATTAVADRQGLLNETNYFPVPDGDTGTNCWRTLQAAAEAPESDCAATYLTAASVAAQRQALGSSGSILAQYLTGLATGWPTGDVVTTADLATALTAADRAAWQAVFRPQPATVLTVTRAVATAAEFAASADVDPHTMCTHLHRVAAESALGTASDLTHGAADAGAVAWVLLFDAFCHAVGAPVAELPQWHCPLPEEAGGDDSGRRGKGPADGVGGWPGASGRWAIEQQEVMAVVTGATGGRTAVAEVAADYGDSVVVMGTEQACRLHVHTATPAELLQALTSLGEVSEVVCQPLSQHGADHGGHPEGSH